MAPTPPPLPPPEHKQVHIYIDQIINELMTIYQTNSCKKKFIYCHSHDYFFHLNHNYKIPKKTIKLSLLLRVENLFRLISPMCLLVTT
jgi:hypothetical protein